ncbi:hypothetical protein C8K30_1011105 [Promicromonospora sp. AC04]|nr:hypothetical protein C8K30_1011105 [Promicromonospora sp. AC04]
MSKQRLSLIATTTSRQARCWRVKIKERRGSIVVGQAEVSAGDTEAVCDTHKDVVGNDLPTSVQYCVDLGLGLTGQPGYPMLRDAELS